MAQRRRRIRASIGEYNLFSDPPDYPVFGSMQERSDYIMGIQVQGFVEQVRALILQEREAEEPEDEFVDGNQGLLDLDNLANGLWSPESPESIFARRVLIDYGAQVPQLENVRERGHDTPEEQFDHDPGSQPSPDSVMNNQGEEDQGFFNVASGESQGESSGSRGRSSSRSRGRGRRGESPNSRRRRRPRSRSRSRDRDRSRERIRWHPDLTIDGQVGAIYPFEQRMKAHMDRMEISYVGDQHPHDAFEPYRGDLIIAHPGGRPPSLPNSVGYLASYLGPNCHEFSNRELVVRSGDFEMRPSTIHGSGGIQNFVYRPFRDLQLYAYSVRRQTKWKYLGSQAPMRNVVLPRDHNSPGKYLKVGSPVLGSDLNVMALVPRRGDMIIRGDSWEENFNHEENFWHSMVKWHRDDPFRWTPGDMLIRRFVDIEHHPSERRGGWGWAELYRLEGPGVGWVFWGRTQLVYDTPWPARSFYMLTYECDNGTDSDDENDRLNYAQNGLRNGLIHNHTY